MPSVPRTSRRQFLQSVAAAGAAGIWLPAMQRAYGYQSPNDRPVFATIGLRNQGWEITQKSFAFADFAALADVDANVLGANVAKVEERQKKQPDAYKDYRRILERDDIDAVMIATPDHWHTKIAVEAMLSGKDVYCEKPLTLTIDEGKLIEKIVAETGRVFQVGTMQRTESEQRFLQAVALVRHGRIGKVKKVTCSIGGEETSPQIPEAAVPEGLDWDFWLGPAAAVPYRALPQMREGYGGGVPLYSNCHYSFRNWHEYSGGKPTDWGAHHVDIACWAIGASDTGPSRITPVEYTLPVEYKDGWPVVDDQFNVATRFTIRAEMPNDVELIVTSDGDNGILFEGTEGRFFVNRGKITGRPVENLESNPLPEGAIEEVYGGPTARQSHGELHRRDESSQAADFRCGRTTACWRSAISATSRCGSAANCSGTRSSREIIGDEQANAFLSREYRQGFEIEMS